MIYLISQILFCLLIAFLLGVLVGWFIGRTPAPKASRNRNADIIQTPPSSGSSFTHSPPPPPVRAATPQPAAMPEKPVEKKPAAKPAARPASTSARPVPANTNTSVDLAADGYEIETLEGVGPKTGEALREVGITSISDFLEKAASAAQRADIAAKIAVRPKMVDSWASMSDLLRIEGVDHQAAELMHASGIQSVDDLADQNAITFIARMESVNSAGKRTIAPEVPSNSQVTDWIAQASRMQPSIEI